MKAFIIHTHHNKSVEYAKKALNSFKEYDGWEPQLFIGITSDTLPTWEIKYPFKMKTDSRVQGFFKNDKRKYMAKKSCALNQYRLWEICVELNEPIAIIEHDSHCIDDWKDYEFDEVLVMNIMSAIRQNALRDKYEKRKRSIKKGIHDIDIDLLYKHDPIKNKHMMPGLAAYAIKPSGAQSLMNVFQNIGWEQGDHTVNTGHVRIQTIVPQLFTFKLPNLRMSHGRNI